MVPGICSFPQKSSLESGNMSSSDFIGIFIPLDFIDNWADFLDDGVRTLPKLVKLWVLICWDNWIVK